MKKKLFTLITVLLCTGFMIYAAFAVRSEQDLAGEVIRLRVVAASDSREDQEIKLQVRDLLLKWMQEADYEARGEALASLKADETAIEESVNAWLVAQEIPYSAEAALGNVLYPTAHYEGFSLPAGNYTALTVTLGDGGGHNWWCVLFPPLCYGAVPEEDAIESSAVLWEDDENLELRFRFRVLEWIEKLKEHRNQVG